MGQIFNLSYILAPSSRAGHTRNKMKTRTFSCFPLFFNGGAFDHQGSTKISFYPCNTNPHGHNGERLLFSVSSNSGDSVVVVM